MTGQNKTKRLLLVIDLVVLSFSFFLAIFIRFHRKPGLDSIGKAYDGLYYLVFELILAIYVAVFFINESGKKSLLEQNPFEKIVRVIKNQLMVSICLVVLLYLIKRGFWASRAVVIMMVCFSTFFDIAARFILDTSLKREAKRLYKARRFLLVSDSPLQESQMKMLCSAQDGSTEIVSTTTPEELTENNGAILSDVQYDGVLVSLKEQDNEGSLQKYFDKLNKPVWRLMDVNGSPVSSDMICSVGDMAAVYDSQLLNCCPVLKVRFSVTNLLEAAKYVKENIESLKGRYICFGNVHTSVMAYEDGEYRDIQNGAAFIMPDGAPIYKEQRRRSFERACRVAGPDFMRTMFLCAMDGSLSMYFYGSTEETIEKLENNLKKTYPGIDLRGFESPPFRELTEEEDREIVERINASGADIVWVGLGAPKQEKWMASHSGRINALMLGVGAGFDFHAGTVKRAPEWVQKIGMEWFYRLLQDPGRLIGRYLITNTKYVIYRLFDNK